MSDVTTPADVLSTLEARNKHALVSSSHQVIAELRDMLGAMIELGYSTQWLATMLKLIEAMDEVAIVTELDLP